METIVKVENLVKTYGKQGKRQYTALRGINFEVQKGEFVGIMGASGSGKTTLLNILSTLDTPTSGKVVINGQDITQLKKKQLADFRGQEIGFIFQDFNLLDNLTNQENIALPLSLQNVKTKQIEIKVRKIAKRLGIEKILEKYPAEISGGQKQRVAAARALIHDPAILFGDEPTGALDSKSATELLNTMSDLNKNDQVSILMVTHDPYSASYADRILFIQDGKIGQELRKDNESREEFYQKIISKLGQR
ncbi:ABC transporter ATP-binding protein [Lactobacillus sp. PV037]|uniref:ABC transporter ATP-binding protein n=1 Tax=unclassified Lactobacillus TaxID=2620435 RepID=UPI00223EDD38|nr:MULTISPECIES: ABC transporter ATP-binding protein [unclassified Lactobacillus]QNQ82781.1 ABC transporter ATP-binding protein [Lactobacillus sp. PV012]QNQ83099.1 ABC transporter ATP-binding protein [Lactobacillus sp. PV037]